MWLQAHGEKASNLAKLSATYGQYFCLFFKKGSSLAPPNLIPDSEVSEVQQFKQKQGFKQLLWRKLDSSLSP